MTFLSRFEFHRKRREARRLLASPSAIHGAVLAAFRDPPVGRAAGRVLWRVDTDNYRSLLYVLSSERPDLTHLVESAGWLEGVGWETAEYDVVLGGLSPDQLWNFRLAANPTRSVREDGLNRSKRVGYVTATQQLDWLLERGDRLGVDFGCAGKAPQVQLVGRSTIDFRHGVTSLTLSTALFEGVFSVTDPDRLRHALLHGIGPGKAYGCGLMTIAPFRSSR